MTPLPRITGARRSPLQYLLGVITGLALSALLNIRCTSVLPTEPPLLSSFSVLPRPGHGDSMGREKLAGDVSLRDVDDGDLHRGYHKHTERGIETGSNLVRAIDDDDVHRDDATEANRLFKEVRVLVFVMTHPDHHDTTVQGVKATWGRRVNKLLFFSSKSNSTVPIIGLNVTEGRQHTTAKCQKAFQYIYKHHFHDADWFFKADNDTYIIMENLRYFLSGQNSSEPVFFGHLFRMHLKQGYFSGGAGYVISKEALRRYGEKGTDILTLCRQDGAGEDLAMSACLEQLGVMAGDDSDALGRGRFHCFDPVYHLEGNYPRWYLELRNGTALVKGVESMSDYSISFHYVPPRVMIALEFYLYHLRPYGIVRGTLQLNRLPLKARTHP